MKRGKREAKRTGLGRRFLSVFLAVVMCTSMLQLPAFAATSYDNQVMDGWFQLNKDNSIKDTTDEEVYEDLGFELTKSIEQTGENAFNITLKVVTSQTVTTNEAAIQLVIDTSTSMDYCSNCSSSSSYNRNCSAHNVSDRMTEVKKVLTMDGGFLDSLVEANTGAINVSVVTYGLGAKTVTLDSADKDQWIDIKDPNALAKVKSAINGLDTTDNATNMQAGLMLARNRLGMDAVKNAAVKYTVLLTDGYANTYTRSDDKNSTTTIANGSSPSSANGTDAGKSNATSMAAQVKATDTLLYAVGYGTDKPYLTDIIGDETKVFVGSDSASVAGAFKDIAEAAVSGMTGAGTSVTDPMGGAGHYTMGQYIVLGELSDEAVANGATATDSAISWELNPANLSKDNIITEGNVTTYIYEITYPITLDTAAKGFEEGKYYPTNGYTYLSVPTDDGVVEIPFNVPGVCGTVPETEWTIEYYLQGDAEAGDYDKYALADDDSASVKVWTPVSAPDGYASKYENYTFVEGQTSMQVVPGGENVMRLYYDHILVPVTVNHYYKTDVITPEGEKIVGEYSTPLSTSESVKVGIDYTAKPETTFGGAEYELKKAEPSSMKITTTKDGENVINLYYTRKDDQRAITSAQVKHIYTTYEYVIENGEYILKNMGSVTETAEQATGIRATTVFSVSPAPKTGYESFELNEGLGDYTDLIQADDTLSFVVAADPAANIRTLHFEQVIDERDPVQVTVNHNYTKIVTTIVDGEVVTNTSTGKFTETENAYAGESFTAVEIDEYAGDEYVSDSGNADKLFIEELDADDEKNVIDLYYTLVVTPKKTDITINHYWRTFTDVTKEVTKEVTDPVTGETTTVVIGTTTETVEDTAHEIEGIKVEGLYIEQNYTAEKKSWGEGYTFNEEDSNRTIVVEGDDVINMYYDLFLEDDVRKDADIDVKHVYTTKLETIVDGKVQIVPVPDGTVTREYSKLAGDEFTATEELTYNNNEYTRITEIAPVILQSGTNATIVINYEREASDLEETSYQINYEYHIYNMTVVNGVAAYPETPSVIEYDEPVKGEGYVKQQVTLEAGGRDGFAPLTTNPSITQTLKVEAKENVWTFVYEQYNPLSKGSVTVNHYYTMETIAINGTSTWTTESVMGAAVEMYLGETFTAETMMNGYDKMDAILDAAAFAANEDGKYELTVSGDHVVDFHYKKLEDKSELVDYTITHIYKQYTWDGEMVGEPVVSAIQGQGYATTQITAAPNTIGFELVESTYNGNDLAAPYTVTLQVGENNIVFVYEQYLAPEKVDVEIIHNYYETEADVKDPEKVPNVYKEVKAGIPEGKCFVANERLIDGYHFYSADPEEMFIVVDDEGENVITINYVRDTAQYKVIHIYNRNGNEEGRTSDILGGLDGDVILADSIERVPEYNGKVYTFKSITDDITLDADEMKTIILVYNRTTGGGGTIIIPETPVPQDPAPQPEPEVEIPEEDVPLVEIPEEEVPLVDVPKTGDASALWLMMSVLSGTGLAGVSILGRKKREEI